MSNRRRWKEAKTKYKYQAFYGVQVSFAFSFCFRVEKRKKNGKKEIHILRSQSDERNVPCIVYTYYWWEWAKMLTHFTQLRFNEKKWNCQSYVQKRQAFGSIINLASFVSKFLARTYHSGWKWDRWKPLSPVLNPHYSFILYKKIRCWKLCAPNKNTKFGEMNENECFEPAAQHINSLTKLLLCSQCDG